MRSIVLIALKDLRIVARDKGALFFLIGFPVILGLFFGMMYNGAGKQPQPGSVPISVVDLDQSPMSASFIELLKQNKTLKIEVLDREPAIERVRGKKSVAVVEIPESFGETAGFVWSDSPPRLRVGNDPSRAASAGMLQGYLMEAMGKLIPQRMSDLNSLRSMVQKQQDLLDQDTSVSPPTRLLAQAMYDSMLSFFEKVNEVQEQAEEQDVTAADQPGFQFAKIESFDIFQTPSDSPLSKLRSPWDISFPSAMLWGAMGSAAGFAISLVRERTRGTLLRLQTAPVTSTQLILGKGLACFLAILGVIAMMTSLGVGLGMRPSQPFFLFISALFVAYCYVGIMMAMSVMGKSEEAVGGAGWAANIVFAMIGGGMIPLAFMPGFLKPLSNFSPVSWAIFSLEGAIWRDLPFSDMLFPWLVLTLVGTVGFAIGVLIFRR